MGIHDFYKIIIKNPKSSYDGKPISDLGKEVKLQDIKNHRVCVDASGVIYSSILAMQRINALTDSKGNITAHINTIFNKVLQLNSFGIQQVWVFDSDKPNPVKADELKRRREKAYKSKDPKVQFRMNAQHVDDIKTLLTMLGVAWIIAPQGLEAEQYGAWLTKGLSLNSRFCQYMLSNDSDVIAFGGTLLRQVSVRSSTGKTTKTTYFIYEYDMILQEMGITHDELLKIAVIMGTDFNAGTPRIGVKTVVAKMRAGKVSYTDSQKRIMEYYKTDLTEIITHNDIKFNDYDKEGLIVYLVSKDFNKERLEKRLEKYKI